MARVSSKIHKWDQGKANGIKSRREVECAKYQIKIANETSIFNRKLYL